MYLVIASDHFGYPLKKVIVEHLRRKISSLKTEGLTLKMKW